jgi:hypothetical protein
MALALLRLRGFLSHREGALTTTGLLLNEKVP